MEINFRKVKKHDIFYRVKWLNDRVVTRFLGDRIYKKQTFRDKQSGLGRIKNLFKKFFTICSYKTSIGIVGLTHINKANKNADLFVMIGDIFLEEGSGGWR